MAEHHYCRGFYKLFIWIANFLAPFVLLVFRLFFGWLFFQAGLGKFSDLDGTAKFFMDLSIPAPMFNAWLVAFVETFCGLALFLGFASRIITIPLIAVMIVALCTDNHNLLMNIFNEPQKFLMQSAPVTYLMACLTVFLWGPGCFSLDYLIEKFWCKDQCQY